jgi:hypothetical protein
MNLLAILAPARLALAEILIPLTLIWKPDHRLDVSGEKESSR